MPILFTMNWDIIPGTEQEYSEFIAKTFIPEATAMSILPVGGYYVEVGFGPRVIGVNTCESHQVLATVVTSQRYKDLILKLKTMVYNFRTAVLEPTGHFKTTSILSKKEYGNSTSITTFGQVKKQSIRTIF